MNLLARSFIGSIDGGDSSKKLLYISCPNGFNGAEIGKRVIVVPVENEWGFANEITLLRRRLEQLEQNEQL